MTDKPKSLIPDMHTKEWVPKIQAGINELVQKVRPKVETGVQEFKDVIASHKLQIHQQSSPWTKPGVVKTGLAIGAVIAITAAGICLYAYWHRDDKKDGSQGEGLYPLLKNGEESTSNKWKSAWNKLWNSE